MTEGMTMAARKRKADKRVEEDFTMSWMLNAPRERVFRAWTEPEELKQWWGPRMFTTPVARVDLRPGGKYFNCMRAPDGKDYCSTGEFREVVAPEKIVYTDSFSDGQGNPVDPAKYGMGADWPKEALVDVSFTELNGMTKVMLHMGVPRSLAERQMAPQGWAESFVKLAEFLEKK